MINFLLKKKFQLKKFGCLLKKIEKKYLISYCEEIY